MVIDGLEPDTVEEILEIEIESMQARHMKGIDMFAKMGGYSPTFGVLGTVMGLVSVLSNLSDPSGLGESIATAFIATLFGVGAANILWLPISANLKGKDAGRGQGATPGPGRDPGHPGRRQPAHRGPEAAAPTPGRRRKSPSARRRPLPRRPSRRPPDGSPQARPSSRRRTTTRSAGS